MQVEDLFKQFSPKQVVQVLAGFLTEERKSRIDAVLERRIKSVQVALEAPADIHNALAVTRSGEALGFSHFHFINAQMVKGQGKSTMRGSARWIHLKRHETVQEFREEMRGWTIVGASMDGKLTIEELSVDRPLCLLFGNERQGLSSAAKEACDHLFRIPMYGMVESFNLSVSAAMSLYVVMKKKRKQLEGKGDLTQQDLLEEKACYYVRSMGINIACDILKRSHT